MPLTCLGTEFDIHVRGPRRSQLVKEACDQAISIPMAAGVVLAEIARRRRTAGRT